MFVFIGVYMYIYIYIWMKISITVSSDSEQAIAAFASFSRYKIKAVQTFVDNIRSFPVLDECNFL